MFLSPVPSIEISEELTESVSCGFCSLACSLMLYLSGSCFLAGDLPVGGVAPFRVKRWDGRLLGGLVCLVEGDAQVLVGSPPDAPARGLAALEKGPSFPLGWPVGVRGCFGRLQGRRRPAGAQSAPFPSVPASFVPTVPCGPFPVELTELTPGVPCCRRGGLDCVCAQMGPRDLPESPAFLTWVFTSTPLFSCRHLPLLILVWSLPRVFRSCEGGVSQVSWGSVFLCLSQLAFV